MKVAVIGAGACGLVAIKSCLDEGLEPVCFEREDCIGGLWNFTADDRDKASVYRTTVINTSKEMMCFSDFSIPKEFPPYMHNSKIMEYFHLYADHFDLYKYIRFHTKVLDIRQTEDYRDTGNWEITYVRLDSPQREEQKEIYNAVMLCIGHHASPSWPTFQGMHEFSGTKMHSHSYKDFRGFEGKRVLVVGIGNSGGDISVELSRHASQVYLSTRKGCWVQSRLHDSGLPLDHWGSRRLLKLSPIQSVIQKRFQRQINKKFDHRAFGLEPSHLPFQQHPTVNDDLPNRIMTGTVILKPNADYFTETGAVFDDGTVVDNLDAVIFCTGYKIGFSFIDKSIIPVENNEVTLYKYVFPPHLTKPTLVVIGCIQPRGAINPIAELQCRWVTRVFKGISTLPTEDEMMKDITQKKEVMAKRYYSSKRHTIQVEYIQYSDEIADLVGCKPSLWKLLFTDPVLAFRCFVGACTPPQYRLTGPGPWPGARDAVMNADVNVTYSTKSRKVKHLKSANLGISFIFKLILFVMIVIAMLIKVKLM